MSSARLTALRLVGFKSFAERTLVEFGPGISAVVGPNGSGKSNLADALRWTLGEQGRTLRTRRSEDVIFAGSSSRRAIGMADVTLVIDNQDRLLPVDFGEVEIGRRLYRSGESEYLLNRQRIRLRDLVELLDAGNLADNAFLFIGQGMVDQALALRPEERRPLFEEAAGVRRHERRRRQAEAELVEAEANLDRVRDVLAELRPQAKRLAAQAEQLQARRTAGVELADGLLAAARARWIGSSQIASRQQKDVDRARAAADAALAALKTAEDEAATLSLAIARRADAERSQRDALDRLRAELTELRVAAARIESDLASVGRDADRLAGERAAVTARAEEAARVLSVAPPEFAGEGVDEELELVERQLDELQAASAPSDSANELRTQSAELDRQQRRRETLARNHAEATRRLGSIDARFTKANQEYQAAADGLRSMDEALAALEVALGAARQDLETARDALAKAQSRASDTEAELSGSRSRIAALEGLVAGADDGLARAARARGAKLLGEGLEVDPRFRVAVSAALGAAATAYLVTEDAVPALTGRRGTVALSGIRGRTAQDRASSAVVEAARAAGGGPLTEALRRDPQSEVTRLLERVVWVPDAASAVAVRRSLAPGWRAVSLAGDVVGDEGIVVLGSGESVIDRRAELDAAKAILADLEQRLAAERRELEARRRDAASATDRAAAAARAFEAGRQQRRTREEAERVTQRRAEQLLREQAWERSQVERLAEELAAVEAIAARLATDVEALQRAAATTAQEAATVVDQQARRAELRARRDELRRARDERNARFQSAIEVRRRMEVQRTLDETRLAELDRDSARVAERSATLGAERDTIAARLTAAEHSAAAAAATLDQLLAAGSDERARLVAAERAAADARDRLRVAESASRQAEMNAMEARLQLEQTREQLLVELATIGADGLRVLRSAAGDVEAELPDDEATAAGTMEDLLDRVVDRWRTEPATAAQESGPSQGRLGSLRRRFNELGAGNPFAVEEYAELRDRLEALEAQRTDMENAIASTRELISSLSALINDQFRTTFAALKDAFERRFQELFGGGDAELSLTAPEDISATGVEIHARPPGKKRQPLSMLSGGERALTAVSLLLAMLEVRPVPFCVLDEVDAALDEANVGRFSKALRGLAERTQFIVITHNRGTIEAADALYGVTIGDDAVSRVVSLRLPGVAGNGANAMADSSANGAANGDGDSSADDTMAEAALA